MYDGPIKDVPVVVTCHDLLAVRGALGEETNCPATFTGKVLQRWILRGLGRATAIICDSQATRDDALRLVRARSASPKIEVVGLGLNYPYRKLPQTEALARLAKISQFHHELPFVLHVGSNLRRKNRDGVLRIFARIKDKWNGRLVFAGDLLDAQLTSLAQELGICDRITQLRDPSDDDEEGFAGDLLRLADRNQRAAWSQKSLENAQRFSTTKMISRYIEIYRTLGAKL
jgi:glycosyltransferase involved in cell wall biosynthesis